MCLCGWLLHRVHWKITLPQNLYLEAVKDGWQNEIILRWKIGKILNKELSGRRNAFNLQQLVRKGLLKDEPGTTWFQGEHEVPCYFFKTTEEGLRQLEGKTR